ncbi:MAG: antitoxin family protein [Chrysiogenetes bacterium]|nr:antitoxin family protein [Chrysiogenetes bacterium]
MSRTIHAIFEDGVFKPVEPADLPSGAVVLVTLDDEVESAREYTGPWPRKFLSGACGDSGRSDISERAEELLEGFGQD